MITAAAVELRSGLPPAPRRRDLPGGPGRPGRPGRPQRRGQDHADQGPRRGHPARGRLDHPQRRGRLPAAGPAHRRPGHHRPRPGAVRPRARHDRARPARRRAARWPAETGEKQDRAMRRYGRLEAEFTAAGGYAAESEAAQIAGALGLDERVLGQELGTLSGGQRRRIELARILFSGAETLLLDEPTNHLDADSIAWLRDYLKGYRGGLVVISHDVELLDAVVNKVFHLDANRGELDQYNLGWKAYLAAARDRRAAPQARAGQRREEGRGADGPGRQDARQGHQDRRRAEHGPPGRAAAVRPRGRAGPRQGGQAALPEARRRAARRRCGRAGCRARTGRRRSSPTSTSPSTAARGSSCSASTAPARPPCCGCSPASTPPTPARSSRATG